MEQKAPIPSSVGNSERGVKEFPSISMVATLPIEAANPSDIPVTLLKQIRPIFLVLDSVQPHASGADIQDIESVQSPISPRELNFTSPLLYYVRTDSGDFIPPQVLEEGKVEAISTGGVATALSAIEWYVGNHLMPPPAERLRDALFKRRGTHLTSALQQYDLG